MAKTPKGQETRERITQAAWALFAEQGYEKTTMRAIAKRAGISLGAAYHYFPSKDFMVLELYTHLQTNRREDLEIICAPHQTPQARVCAVMEHSLQILAPHRAVLMRLASAAMEPNSPLSPFGKETAASRQSAVSMFHVALEPHLPTFHASMRPVLPRFIWLVWMGVVLFWLHDKSPAQQKTVRLVQRGIPMVFQALHLLSFPLAEGIRNEVLGLFAELAAPLPPSAPTG